jgi:signal transduction histidine kinase
MNSFRLKLILVLSFAIVAISLVIGFLSAKNMKTILNRELERSYSTQLNTIIHNLEKKHNQLIKSGLEGLYSEGYKESQIKFLKDQYYKYPGAILPVIFNENKKILLSPFNQTHFTHTINEDGSSYIIIDNEKWWMVHKFFKPWNWTIGYAIKFDDKNAGFTDFTNILLMSLLITSIFFITIFSLILSNFLNPIKELSQQVQNIKDGEFDVDIKVYNPNDEIGILSLAFKKMLSDMSKYLKEKIEYEKEQNAILEEKVAERTYQLKCSNEDLINANKNKQSLIRVLGHDLSNPLSIILSSTKIVIRKNKDEKILKLITNIDKASNTIKDITKSITDMEALKSGKNKIELGPVVINDVIEHTKFIFEEPLKSKEINLEYIFDTDENIKVIAEKTSLSNQVINNLVSNAIKFSLRGSTITIITKHIDEEVCIEILDKGVGMPPEMVKNSFDHEIETSRKGTNGESGTGFGLPLVKSYMDRYGARIEIESKEKSHDSKEHGTTIRLFLKKG